jgi:hypothetical protein
VRSCRERLAELLFIPHEDRLPEIPMRRLRDNQGNREAGWSFCREEENGAVFAKAGLGADGERWLWRRLMRDGEEAMQETFFEPISDAVRRWEDIPWKPHGIWEYFERVKTFKEELIVLYHLSAGAPGRGPEVMSIPFKNDPDGLVHRGIFVHDGMVELVSEYHKGAGSSGKGKVVHRFVAREVGEIVVMFLWAVEPFVQMLQTVQKRQSGRENFIADGYQMWEIRPEEEFAGVGDEGEESQSQSEGESEGESSSQGSSEDEGEGGRPAEPASSEESEGDSEDGQPRTSQPPRAKQKAEQAECPHVDGW